MENLFNYTSFRAPLATEPSYEDTITKLDSKTVRRLLVKFLGLILLRLARHSQAKSPRQH